MYLFRMRHLLFLLLGLITLISLAALAWAGRLALHDLHEARQLLRINDISELTLQLNTNSAMERGITAAMLANPSASTETMALELQRLRRVNEERGIELLAAVEDLLEIDFNSPLHDALDGLRRERQNLLRARGNADIMLQHRERGGEARFVAAITNFIEATAAVRHYALALAGHSDVLRHEHLAAKDALYTASEYSGRERALLGIAIAQGRGLTRSEHETLLGMRHTAQVALAQLDMTVAAFSDQPEVTIAHAAMNAEFRHRYQRLREQVYGAAVQGKAYPVDVTTWYQEATRGISSILALGEAINRVVSQRARHTLRRAQEIVVVFATAAMLVMAMLLTATMIIRRRIIMPLHQLERAANAISRGDYAEPLQVPRGDELGELGATLDEMRANLLEQMQERDRIEGLLRDSVQRFRNLVESTNDLLWEIDGAGRYTYVSPQIRNILGYEPDEVIGRTPFDLMQPGEAARLETVFHELVTQRAPIRGLENINRHKDGRLIVLETNGVPVYDDSGTFVGYRGIDRDVTERREVEQAQRESERRFRDLLENMQLMAVMLDDGGNITFINDCLLHSTGRNRQEVMGGNWFELFLPEDLRGALRATYLRTMAGGQPASPHEYEIITAGGERRRVVWNSIVIRGPDERPVGSASVGADVTEQRKSEAETQKLLRVVEQTDDVVMITDPAGIIEYVNAAFERETGYRRAEVIGQSSRILHSGVQDAGFYKKMWDTISSGHSFRALMVNRRKNGELFYEEKTITPLRDSNNVITHYLSTSKDVTERRRLDEQMQQSEKLASIGQLAAGVAHEINNPVGYISSNIATLTRYLDGIFRLLNAYEEAENAIGDSALRERLHALKQEVDLAFLRDDIRALIDESSEGVARVKKIVQDLKDFSRQEEAEWQMADVHKGLESTLNIVHNELKYKAEVVREYADLPLVECIPSQLNQVFLNLLVNAAQAIDHHGVIHVRSGMDGAWCWVEVEDNGKGIPPEHINRLFEPFFTTKPVGKGTGLGLSISYGIVQKHGGRIEVDSEVGRGSRFRVWLPLRQPGSATAEAGEGQ
nr:PAS domain S-box protein [Sulfurivermis fontis]